MTKKLLIGSAIIVAIGAIALSAMGGTAWLDGNGFRGSQRQVESRVQAYWTARVSGDLSEQASYLHPLQNSISSPGMLITEGFEVQEVQVEGDEAIAKLTVQSRLRHPVLSSRQRETEMVEHWVRYEGEWYRGLIPENLSELIKYKKGEWTPPTAEAVSIDDTPNVQ